jgi:serine/threonine-protein kinase RsbW
MADAETVTVPATTAGIQTALDALDAFSHRVHAPDPVRRRMLTALDEVLSNVVRHGTVGPGSSIVVTATPGVGDVSVDVADASAPFDPLSLPPPDTTSTLEARRAGGLGIALVRALADQVRYERRDDRNHLTMIWRTTPDGDGEAHAD